MVKEKVGSLAAVRISTVFFLLMTGTAAAADECALRYHELSEEIESRDPALEAILKYCEGKHHFKELSGSENPVPGVPGRFLALPIPRETIVHADVIACDQQSRYLSEFEAYVLEFNQQMASCLENGEECCPARPRVEPCTDTVAAVDKEAEIITDSEIQKFLNTFRDPGCRSVEYSEWANEMVFTLMAKAPEKFFRALKSAESSVEEAISEDVLDHPIHDLINYPKIMTAIETEIADANIRHYADDLFRPYYDEHVLYRDSWEKENDQKWIYEQ